MPVQRQRKDITPDTPGSTQEQTTPSLPNQQTFQQYLRELARAALRVVLEGVMREELDALFGVDWARETPSAKVGSGVDVFLSFLGFSLHGWNCFCSLSAFWLAPDSLHPRFHAFIPVQTHPLAKLYFARKMCLIESETCQRQTCAPITTSLQPRARITSSALHCVGWNV